MNREALLDPVPIRFDRKTKKRVETAAKRFGLPAAELIRRAVETSLPTWEDSGVMIIQTRKEEGK